MTDDLAKKLAEAKQKMFGPPKPSATKIVLIVKGHARVKTSNPNTMVKQ